MATRVCLIFRQNFGKKKAPRSSRLVLGFRSYGPTGLKMGSLAIHFPVWRELKRGLIVVRVGWVGCVCLLYTFPFEGNWNNWTLTRAFNSDSLAIHFPVWRELKLLCLLFDGWAIYWLAIHFPVWRELKHSCHQLRIQEIPSLLYTFPFEGNWN